MLPEMVRLCCKTTYVRGQSLTPRFLFSLDCFFVCLFLLFVLFRLFLGVCVTAPVLYIYSYYLPDAGNIEKYPAYYEPVVAVAATDNNRVATWFTNYGEWINISAPGDQVLSTINNNGYGRKSGTSMACPHVAGTYIIYINVYRSKTNQHPTSNNNNREKQLCATKNIKTGEQNNPLHAFPQSQPLFFVTYMVCCLSHLHLSLSLSLYYTRRCICPGQGRATQCDCHEFD